MSDPTTFIHLTDLHVGDPKFADDNLYSDTSATLEAVLSDVKALSPRPKFIVASGDLTNRGDVASFAELKRIFDESGLDVPVIWALGNHDTREGFYRAMLGRTDDLAAPYFHDQVIADIHIITLDSSTPGNVGGMIEPEQFAWLEKVLDTRADLPKLIVVHHGPALDEDLPEMEWESLTIADTLKLRGILKGYNIIGMLSGHVHYDRLSNWYGIPLIVGMGQHAAMDVRYLNEGLRMVRGTSFAVATVRPSGLTLSLIPQPSTREELHTISFERLKHYIAKAQQELHADQSTAAE